MHKSSLLIAESGSSKTQWCLIRDGVRVEEFFSAGVNPNVLTEEAIEDIFRSTFGENLHTNPPTDLIFYGAGIGAPSQKALIETILHSILPKVKISVEHDLLAAIRATHRPHGIVAILGTGSNSALHRDYRILSNLGGHGFLFGDEGSGMDLGRHLIKGLLQDEFPDEVREYIEEAEGKRIYDIKLAIHASSKPNVRMAELARHLSVLTHLSAISEMITGRFLAFLDTSICRYPDYRELSTDVVGSIGHHYREQLVAACERREVRLGSIIARPVDRLIEYHLMQLDSAVR